MAGAFVSLVFDAVHDVGNAKVTLLAIADRANKDDGGDAWPSVRDISERADKCERQTRDDLRMIEAKGWLRRLAPGGGRKKTTIYQLEIVRMLLALSPQKGAVHLRELRKLPGAVPPGFELPKTPTNPTNPAVSDTKPGTQTAKPGSPAQETRQPTAPEPEVELESITGSGTGTRAHVTPIIKKLKGEPDKPARPHMTQAEQVAYVALKKPS